MNNNKIKYFFIVILTIFISFSILGVCSKNIAESRYENGDNDFNNILYLNGFWKEKENTIDVVSLGDSYVTCAFNPLQIWNQTGVTSYACGTNAQKISETYAILRRVFKKQNPKIVFMSASLLFSDCDVMSYLISNIYYSIPLFYYHDQWKNIIFKSDKEDIETPIYKNKGYRYIGKIDSANLDDYMKKSIENCDIDSNVIWFFDRICKLCKNNEAQLILIGYPSFSWNDKYSDKVEILAKEKNIDFYDYNKTLHIDWEKDTCDKGEHLNFSGALKFSNCISDLLNNTRYFQSKKDISGYSNWNNLYYEFAKNHVN